MRTPPASAAALAGMLLAAGATHLVAPRPYESLIPAALGSPRAWVLGSGLAELACGAAVAVPASRRAGGFAAAALLVAVFPGNVVMALRSRAPGVGRGGPPPTGLAALTRRPVVAWGRLPLQVPLVAWALSVARSAR